MADENRFTVVAEWLNDWLALNGTVSENDPEKLSKFMREFGEQVIDYGGYYRHNGANLILYSGSVADVPAWQIVAGYCKANPDCYYNIST